MLEPVSFTVRAVAVTDGILYSDSKESFGVIVSYEWMNEKAGSPNAYNVMYAKVAAGRSGKTATADQIKDTVDRFNDRHLHMVFPSEGEPRLGGVNAFDNHLHLVHRLLHALSPADQDACPAVAAVHTRAGDNQVPDAGKPGKGLGLCAHRDAKPRDLGDSSRHQGGFCIVAAAKAVAGSRGKGDHVFQGTAELDPEDVGIHVNPEIGRHEKVLDLFRRIFFPCARDDCRRNTDAYLLRMARAGKDRDIRLRQFVFNLFGDCLKRTLLNSLCDADNQLALRDEGIHPSRRPPGVYGGDREDDHLPAAAGLFKVRRKKNILRDDCSRKIFAFPCLLKCFDFLRKGRPGAHPVSVPVKDEA